MKSPLLHLSTNEVIPMTAIRVLKVATCKSLSGSSDLTYHLGGNAENKNIVSLFFHYKA